MNREELLLVGLGGAGNKVVDTIVDTDMRFPAYFINSAKTDIESLNNYDNIDKNYFCISNQNGTGRDRNLGKAFAQKKGMNMLDILLRHDEKTLFFVTSLGGGSGSSIISVLLNGISRIKEDPDMDFDKTINLICILPSLDSPDVVLQNAIDTWNEIMSYNCVNSMMFIDNNTMSNGNLLDEDSINQIFAEEFTALFDIPSTNGRNFDNGNLRKLINSKGCIYIYDLPSGCESIQEALSVAERNSVVSRMYKSDQILDKTNGLERIQCSCLGTSFNDESYSHDELNISYKANDNFDGFNEEHNLLLLSGAMPPKTAIDLIEKELTNRENTINVNMDFNKFKVSNTTKNNVQNKKGANNLFKNPKTNDKDKMMKKALKRKKNLFDIL